MTRTYETYEALQHDVDVLDGMAYVYKLTNGHYLVSSQWYRSRRNQYIARVEELRYGHAAMHRQEALL